jgi:hypothetical protein
MNCLSCTAETTNGLAMCQRCQQTLRVALVNAGSYYADVEKIKPGQRVRVSSAYRSTPPPEIEPARDPISDALNALDNAVSTWARMLCDDRPGIGKTPTSTTSTIGWLESHVPSISTLEWCGEMVREIRAHERSLRRILDKADTGSYVGTCGNEIGREWTDGEVVPVLCERHLYAVESTAWVQCPECGRNWDTAERRSKMLADVRSQLLPLRAVARILVRLTDEPSVERLTRRIEKWVEREQIQDYGVRVLDGKPRRVYRVGEVEDKLDLPKRVEPDTEPAEAC